MPKSALSGVRQKMKKKLVVTLRIGFGQIKPDTYSVKKEWERYSEVPRIWMLGTEDYGNLGDHKIAVAQKHFFETYFPNYEYIEVSARNYFESRQQVIDSVCGKDIVVSTGGGNMGNKYPFSEKIHQDIVTTFMNNRVVIMPQTIWYTDDEAGRKEMGLAVKLYGQNKNLLIAVREDKSYKLIKEHFRNEVVLVPDIVLFDGIYEKKKTKHSQNINKAIVCLRQDLETNISKGQRKEIVALVKAEYEKIEYIDTQKEYLISVEEREKELNDFFEKINGADIVITDRLHGMIFSAISEVPCVVFDNQNGKVRGVYEWMKELPYIRYVDSGINIKSDIAALKQLQNDYEFKINGLEERFADFAKRIDSGEES